MYDGTEKVLNETNTTLALALETQANIEAYMKRLTQFIHKLRICTLLLTYDIIVC